MSLHRKLFVALLCCLVELSICGNIDAERLQFAESKIHHSHRRRSVEQDPRYLNFKFDLEPESTTINVNSASIFHCAYHLANSVLTAKSSEEFPIDARIEWRKDGTSVEHIRFAGRIRTLENGSLLIENARTADEGVYQCAVYVNSAPFISPTPWIFLSRRVTLRAALFDRFEVQPVDQSVFSGQKASFRCLINSKPIAAVEWYKDNIQLKAEGTKSILPISQTLEIFNVSSADEGNYKCAARSGSKIRSSQIASLYVKEDVSDIAGTLSVVAEPRSQVHKAGDSFILECLVNGFPAPKIRWFYNGAPLLTQTRTRFVGCENSSVLVEDSKLTDSGNYVCRAENGEDNVELAAVISIRTPPTITVAPKEQSTQETLDAEFECMAEGSPKPRITWYKNGEVIIPSEYFVIASNRLKIFGLVRDDQGVYQCFAENDMGSTQASAQLLVDAAASHLALTADSTLTADKQKKDAPLQPLALKATEVGSKSISLSWDSPPHSSSISLYHIFFREEDSTRERLVNTTANFVVIPSLQPNTVYVIRVAGENAAGLGKASDSIRVATKHEDTVPGKVRNLRAKVLGSETIQVDWDAPNSGAEASRYRLFYIKANSSEDERETQVLMVKTSYTLHGMEKFTKYFIRVEAEGANGVGPNSDRLEVQTFSDVPSVPPKNIRLDALSPKVIRVRWTAPDVEQRNGPIIGYKIRYRTKRKGAKGSVAVVEDDPGVYVIEDLEPGSHYTMRIAAMTANGTGTFSDWLGVDTPMEEREETQIAGAPSELRVHAGHDFVEVSWLPPSDDSVMVRGYLIGWGVNIPDVEKTSVDANVRHYTIKGLKPSREYVISLRAFNNVGNGFPIYETVQTSAYGYGRSLFHPSSNDDLQHAGASKTVQMSTPIGVIAEPISASSIRLSWTDPNDGFNQYYTVRYSVSSDTNGNARQFNTSETEVVVDGLKPNTQYEFAVRLVESNEWSMSAVNKTFAAPPSSAPRDLSIFAASPTGADNDNSADAVTLSWQPPKYANGEVEEYIVLYSDKLELSDKDWIMDSVKGDRLSMTIENLLPMSTYYFKIQARNVKGYGPLSPVATYSSQRHGDYAQPKVFNIQHRQRLNNDAFHAQLGQILTSNFIYVLIGIVSVVLLFLIVVLAVVCVQRKPSSTSSSNGKAKNRNYVESRKYSTSTLSRHNSSQQQQQPDLWIHQQLQQQNSGINGGARFALLANGAGTTREIPVEFIEVSTPPHAHEMKRFGGGVAQHLTSTADSLPPRYQTLQDGETLTRSYHQSSASLEMTRQKTPQILYTGVNRQPIAKVEFAPSSEQGSHAGSSTMLMSNANTPPPPSSLNNDYCSTDDYHQHHHGASSSSSASYQVLRTLNPLKSFAQMGGAPPLPNSAVSSHSPYLSSGGSDADQNGYGGHRAKTAHIVRPVVVASPSLRNSSPGGKPAGVVIGQKSSTYDGSKLPVGRATAQPRIDVSEGIHSPYSTVRITTDALNSNNNFNGGFGGMKTMDYRRESCNNEETKPLKSVISADDINEIENYGIDHMIDTLQQLQQEFTD